VKVRTTLLFLLLLALPVSSFSQSTLNFPRLFSVADLGLSGFAVVNPAATTANVTFTLYSAGGLSIGAATLPIDPRGQIAKLGTEFFCTPTCPASGGWIQATSTTTGLQGFWFGGDFSTIMDGAEGAPVGPEFIFPLATAATELNVANLSTSSNTLTIRIYNAAGTELAAFVQPPALAPKGIYKNTLATIFPSVNFANAMYVKVTGTGNLTGTTVAVDFIHTPSWSVINGVSTSSLVTEANFPHVPSGPESGGAKWTSILGLTNLSATAQTVTITYNRSTGSPVSTTRTLAGNGSLRESAQSLFSFAGPSEDGWVKVTGTAPIGGFIAYGYSGTNGVAVVPVQTTPQTQLIFSHVANDGITWGSGMALLNATTIDAVVEIYIMRRDGSLVGGAASDLLASINLPAGTKTAKLLDELVPRARANDGFVFVKSANNVPLYAFELFFSTNVQVIANVAAGAVDPSITFVPPPPSGAITPLPPLNMSAITPSPAVRGSAVTITGAGFNATPASNAVVFTTATGSISATPSAGSTTSLIVTVPVTAITGPVYVTTGGRFTSSIVLSVNATLATSVTSNVTVGASSNTIADIYVAAPVSPFDGNALGISLVTDLSAGIGGSSVETPTGVSRRLWITGTGISSATNVAISGPGVTVTSSGVTAPDYVIVHIAVAAGATVGPRNIILTNSSLDTSIITGGLIIR
jgi:hypothetical protein